MAKQKGARKGSVENPLKAEDIVNILSKEKPLRSYIITKANIKDDICGYTFEITDGIGLGDKHKVDTKAGIVKDTLTDAFQTFRAHLAAIDDVFKHAGIEITDIDMMHNDDLTGLYFVTGFEIYGGEENESIVILGNKFVSCVGGRIEMKTPKIPLDNLSSYQWYNELKAAADIAREEVCLYKEGNYIPVAKDEPEDTSVVQLTIGSKEAMDADHDGEEIEAQEDEILEAEFEKPSPASLMEDFDNAKM